MESYEGIRGYLQSIFQISNAFDIIAGTEIGDCSNQNVYYVILYLMVSHEAL